MSNPKLTFVTANPHKLNEVKQLLSHLPLTLTNEPLDLTEIQDPNLEAISLSKCTEAISLLPPHVPVFVEDTALKFDEFNGLPGPYIKWFLQSMGLSKLVKTLSAFENKGAEAVTTICYADKEGTLHTFEGVTRGKIVESRGDVCFGWDSIFEPCGGGGLTYGEMEKGVKNGLSHRGKAFVKFGEYLEKNGV